MDDEPYFDAHVENLTPLGEDGDIKRDSAVVELRATGLGNFASHTFVSLTVENLAVYRRLHDAMRAGEPVRFRLEFPEA